MSRSRLSRSSKSLMVVSWSSLAVFSCLFCVGCSGCGSGVVGSGFGCSSASGSVLNEVCWFVSDTVSTSSNGDGTPMVGMCAMSIFGSVFAVVMVSLSGSIWSSLSTASVNFSGSLSESNSSSVALMNSSLAMIFPFLI